MFSAQSYRNLYEVSFKKNNVKHLREQILAIVLVECRKMFHVAAA